MKIKLPILALIILTLFSCDELDKLTEFDVKDNFGATLEVSVSEGASTTWSQNVTIDLASNTEVQENLDLIQNVTVNNISFEITNYLGAADILLTEASITIAETTMAVNSAINLKAADDSNETFTIGTATQWAVIAAYLQQSESVTATLSGIVSGTPVDFKVVIDVDATITIDVI